MFIYKSCELTPFLCSSIQLRGVVRSFVAGSLQLFGPIISSLDRILHCSVHGSGLSANFFGYLWFVSAVPTKA